MSDQTTVIPSCPLCSGRGFGDRRTVNEHCWVGARDGRRVIVLKRHGTPTQLERALIDAVARRVAPTARWKLAGGHTDHFHLHEVTQQVPQPADHG